MEDAILLFGSLICWGFAGFFFCAFCVHLAEIYRAHHARNVAAAISTTTDEIKLRQDISDWAKERRP